MAKITRTTTQTATVRVPYHFTCNYCGKRNDQSVSLSGVASESRSSSYQHASGTLGVDARKNLMESVDLTSKMIREYGDGLRAGQAKAGCLIPFYGTVCCYCGKEQAWSRLPGSGTGKRRSRKGCLIPVAGLVLAVLLFVIATMLSGTPAADIIGFSGFGVLIAGVVLYFVYPRLGRKRNAADSAAEPNDPDNLPVLDLQDLGKPAFVPAEDRLAAPARIRLLRESSFVYNAVKPDFQLNTVEIGSLANGESLNAVTNRKHNVLYATDGNYGNSFRPLVFETDSGADAEIHFKATGFLPDKCTGIRVVKPE